MSAVSGGRDNRKKESPSIFGMGSQARKLRDGRGVPTQGPSLATIRDGFVTAIGAEERFISFLKHLRQTVTIRIQL